MTAKAAGVAMRAAPAHHQPAPRAPGAENEGRASVLAALMAGATTYPELMDATGMGKGHLHHHLAVLRNDGWCTWERGHQGTLRATFECAWPAYTLKEAHRGR